MSENVTHVTNHWWWRPGWREGRHFYACHLTLDDQPDLRRLGGEYQAATKSLSMLDHIPPEWLHITMQGIGFIDEVDQGALAAIHQSMANRLSQTKPPAVTFDRPTIRPEAVYLMARPAEALYQVRQSLHSSVLAVLGSDRFSEPMPKPKDFTPHVSIAYVNAEAPARPIAAALESVKTAPVTATFAKADLLVFHRDNRMYEWLSATPIPFGIKADTSD